MFGRYACAALLCVTLAAGAAERPREVANGTHCRIEKAQNVVVKTQPQWTDLWSSMHEREGAPAAPKVDFDKEMLLATFLGTRTTGGYAVTIQSATATKDKLVVTVVEKKPAPGERTPKHLTQPFDIVAVPKSDLAVEWRTGERREGRGARSDGS